MTKWLNDPIRRGFHDHTNTQWHRSDSNRNRKADVLIEGERISQVGLGFAAPPTPA